MAPPGWGTAPQLSLEDLDDALLLRVLAHLHPAPDLFQVAATCRRFRDLALDRRSWLYVTHAARGAGGLASPPARRAERPQQPPPARTASGVALAAGGTAGGSGIAVDDSPHWYRSQFGSLAEAVAASRPGDTILLEAGPAPHVVCGAPVVVRHPLHILGGGASGAGECVLQGARGLEALLDFRRVLGGLKGRLRGASGRLANLTLRATAGACVAHSRGRLTVQGCTLDCDPCGLPHLSALLLTRAVSYPQPPATPAAGTSGRQLEELPAGGAAGAAAAAAAVAGVGQKRPASPAIDGLPAAKRLQAWVRGSAAAGAGVLSVAETRIKARGAAVELRGSGRLSNVRALYCSGHALVWLEVDSANSSSSGASGLEVRLAEAASAVPNAAAPLAAASASGGGLAAVAAAPAVPCTPAPSWLGRAAAAGFDPAAFQRRAAALAASSATPCGPPSEEQQAQQAAPMPAPVAAPPAQGAGASGGSMARKKEEWCVLHASVLAPTPAAAVPPPRPGPQ